MNPFRRALATQLSAGGGGGGGSFVPSSGLVGWWDAADADTITTGTGGVATWADKSTTGADLSQATTGRRPATGGRTINGVNALEFSGAQDMFSPSVDALNLHNSDWTVLVVCEFDVNNKFHSVVAKSSASQADGRWYLQRSTTQIEYILDVGDGPGTKAVIASTETATPLLLVGRGERGGNSNVTKNGTAGSNIALAAGADLTTSSQICVGSYYGSFSQEVDGLIGEILVYNRVLGTEENTTLTDGLADKWGITLA